MVAYRTLHYSLLLYELARHRSSSRLSTLGISSAVRIGGGGFRVLYRLRSGVAGVCFWSFGPDLDSDLDWRERV